MDCKIVILLRKQAEFESVCDKIEEYIVKENLARYGGTLRYSCLTYDADYLFLALVDNVPVGYCAVVKDYDSYYIYQIGVKKEFQQKGIGRAMMQQVMALAARDNMDIKAHVREYNENSKKMFIGLGFEKTGVEGDNGAYRYHQESVAIGGR